MRMDIYDKKYEEINLKQLFWENGNLTGLGFLKLIEKRGYKLVKEKQDGCD
jgi:hypothetical protein